MKKQNPKKIFYKIPKTFTSKFIKVQNFIEKYAPFLYINKLCGFKKIWSNSIIISHKKLGFAAEFKLPNKIIIDFSNNPKYISLCIAHEYTHLLLRTSTSLPYHIEQTIAILSQLSYEDKAGIREFNKKTAAELMKIMDVWPSGKIILNNWRHYLEDNVKEGKKYKNIIFWLKTII